MKGERERQRGSERKEEERNNGSFSCLPCLSFFLSVHLSPVVRLGSSGGDEDDDDVSLRAGAERQKKKKRKQ